MSVGQIVVVQEMIKEKKIFKLIPHAKIISIKNAMHMLQIMNPNSLANEINKFISIVDRCK